MQVRYAPADPQVSHLHLAPEGVSTTPTPASACFVEPVTYTKVVVKPVAPDAEARLLKCDASATEAGRADCRFAVAREYWEANRLERAGALFLTVAHSKGAINAAAAAQLALESINTLGAFAEPPRAACSDLMANEIPKLLAELCTPTPRLGAERVCAMMHIVDIDLTRCSECAPGTVSGRDPDTAYRAAAEIYLKLASEQCVLGKGRQALNESLRCDELLYKAFRWFSSSHDSTRAAQAKALLLDPKNGLRHTGFAKRLLATP
jgi:hypothetical protein